MSNYSAGLSVPGLPLPIDSGSFQAVDLTWTPAQINLPPEFIGTYIDAIAGVLTLTADPANQAEIRISARPSAEAVFYPDEGVYFNVAVQPGETKIVPFVLPSGLRLLGSNQVLLTLRIEQLGYVNTKATVEAFDLFVKSSIEPYTLDRVSAMGAISRNVDQVFHKGATRYLPYNANNDYNNPISVTVAEPVYNDVYADEYISAVAVSADVTNNLAGISGTFTLFVDNGYGGYPMASGHHAEPGETVRLGFTSGDGFQRNDGNYGYFQVRFTPDFYDEEQVGDFTINNMALGYLVEFPATDGGEGGEGGEGGPCPGIAYFSHVIPSCVSSPGPL